MQVRYVNEESRALLPGFLLNGCRRSETKPLRKAAPLLKDNPKMKGYSMYSASIADFLQLVCEPDCVYELRCPKAGKFRTVSGYFADLKQLADDAEHWSDQFMPGVYFTINPVAPALLARCANAAKGYAVHTTADADIIRRRLVLIDFDPVRPAGISSDDKEHTAAIERAEAVRDWLSARGFPAPVVGDSGNGAHLLYRVDLPNDAASTSLVKGFLESLAGKFGDGVIAVDRTTYNASRISKIYGTVSRKGDHTPDRPHRTSGIVSAPNALEVVSADLLAGVVSELGGDDPKATTTAQTPHEGIELNVPSVGWVDEFINAHSIGVACRKPGGGSWACRWVLASCPFCGETDGSAVITVGVGGRIGFKCHHNRCVGKRWGDFRKHHEPDWVGADEQPDDLLSLVMDAGELWHNADDGFITVGNRSHKIGSGAFGAWLRGEWFKETAKGIAEAKFREVCETVKAAALFGSPEYPVHHRVARHDGNIFIDIGDDTGAAVKITPDGWEVIDAPPVKFVRSPTTGELPRPIKSDDDGLKHLRAFVNLPDADFVLFVGSLLDALKASGPYLVNVITGEHGAAKSSVCRLAVRLVDPQRKSELRGTVRDEQDLAVAAANRHVLALDNISRLPDWLSDALCRVSTGGGFSARKLYSDGDEAVFQFVRPVWMNGIEDFMTRPDLISRSCSLFTLRIGDDARRDEDELWGEFNRVSPVILGTLYDAVAHGLRAEKSVRLARKPRMADTAKWLAACLPAFGWEYAAWEEAFAEKQNDAEEAAVDGSVVASCLRSWWDGKEHTLTPGELYEALKAHCPPDKDKFFPANAKTLTNHLRRIAPALRTLGVDYFRPDKKQKVGGASVKIVVVRPVPNVPDHEHGAGVADPHATVASAGCQLPGVASEQKSLATTKALENQALSGRLPVVASDLRLLNKEEKKVEEGGIGCVSESSANRWQPLATDAETLENVGENGLPANKDGWQPLATTGNSQTIPSRQPYNMAFGWWVKPVEGEPKRWMVIHDDGRTHGPYTEQHALHIGRQMSRTEQQRKYKELRRWYGGSAA